MMQSKLLVFIGDVHGQYQALLSLLEKLGFQNTEHGWQHKSATAAFLGDLIDRGPQSREVVETVRTMVEHGSAVCIMGNHELNAIHYHTPDGHGSYLRPHSEKNTEQHEHTLQSYRHDYSGLREALSWFRTLPLALDWGDVRAVHATWSDNHLPNLEKREIGYYIGTESQVHSAAIKGTTEHDATEILLKGAEITLPNGARFMDKSGKVWRTEARLKWWRQTHPSWKDAIAVPNKPEGLDLHSEPEIPDNYKSLLYPETAPPVFFGHYWMSGELKLQAHNAFCADYSAGKGDRLCSYIWMQESRLTMQNVVFVSIQK